MSGSMLSSAGWEHNCSQPSAQLPPAERRNKRHSTLCQAHVRDYSCSAGVERCWARDSSLSHCNLEPLTLTRPYEMGLD